jgi:excisionase family DNA binding protein
VPGADNRWATIAEVADYLQISRAKLYAMAQANEIPCSQVAGQRRISRVEIAPRMREQRHRTSTGGDDR